MQCRAATLTRTGRVQHTAPGRAQGRPATLTCKGGEQQAALGKGSAWPHHDTTLLVAPPYPVPVAAVHHAPAAAALDFAQLPAVSARSPAPPLPPVLPAALPLARAPVQLCACAPQRPCSCAAMPMYTCALVHLCFCAAVRPSTCAPAPLCTCAHVHLCASHLWLL